MKYKELISKSEAEVSKMLEELRQETHDFSVKMKLNQEKQTHKFRGMKKDIARLMTYLHNLKK